MATRQTVVMFLAVLILAIVLPAFGLSEYLKGVLVIAFLFVVLSVGLDLVLGYCGQLSFAQGAFYGVGAYTAAILYRDAGVTFWTTLPVSILSAGLFGVLLGLPALRLGGHFLAIVTIAFQTIAFLLMSSWTTLTGGQYGIDLPRMVPFESFGASRVTGFYYLALAAAAASVAVAGYLVQSRLGRHWTAIREDELLAKALGLNTTWAKLFVFALTAAMAGAAGAINVSFLQGAFPQDFGILTSATVVAMVLVGGRATVLGPIVGALFFSALPEVFRFAADYKLIIYGVIMAASIIWMPAGIVGTIRSRNRTKAPMSSTPADTRTENGAVAG
jgi:branched-chain amino acid transport system permease protein